MTADDRILETISKPKENVESIINSPNYIQIFTDRLTDAYDVVEDSWFTIAVEGFDGYADLVKLYRDESDNMAFEVQADDQFYFQSLAENDNRLVESLGLHLDAYDLDRPMQIGGDINLYAGKGTHPFGDVFVEQEFSMDWAGNYHVDVDTFDVDSFNEKFFLSELPLTSNEPYVNGELYFHRRIDISNPDNVITSDLPANVQFAIVLPNSTERLDSVFVSDIDKIAEPWDWCESWQGYAFTESDYITYNPEMAKSMPSQINLH
jgi:hypothetical protein